MVMMSIIDVVVGLRSIPLLEETSRTIISSLELLDQSILAKAFRSSRNLLFKLLLIQRVESLQYFTRRGID